MRSLEISGTDKKGRSARRHLLSSAGIAGLLLCGGLAFALLSGNSGRVPAVTLSFVGFTNQTLAIVSNTAGVRQEVILFRKALLMAKNNGSVAVELYALISEDKFSTNAGIIGFKNGFWPVEAVGLPRVLKPGQSMLLVAHVGEGVPWSTEVSYQRRAFADRFFWQLWNSGVAPLQALAQRSGSSRWQLVPVKVGPLTNQPSLPEAGAPIPGGYITIERPVPWVPGALPPQAHSLDLIDTHYELPDVVEKP